MIESPRILYKITQYSKNQIFRQCQSRTQQDTTSKSSYLQDPPDHEESHPFSQQGTT